MTKPRKRKNYSPEQKATLVLEHLHKGRSVSDICEENDLQVNVFYRWQSEFISNASQAFVKDKAKVRKAEDKKIDDLKSTMTNKDNIIAELVAENIKLKKHHGLL